MQKYSEIVATTKADGTVEVLPGATVTVYLTGTTTLASLYSDNGITAKANPFQSAALTGRIEFYAADGRYDIKIDKAGYTTVTVADILIEDPEDIGVLEDVTLVDATISTSTVTNSTLSQCILVNTEIQDVDSLQLTDTPPAVLQPRMLSWNNAEGTADLSLLDGTVLQMGQELHYRARNNTASTIADGAVVWATGTSGATGRINVGLAVADGSQPGKTVMGLMTHATAAGSDGYVANFGKVRGINTTGSAVGETWLNGDILYLHPTIPGALTKVKPAVNGNIVVTVAIVIYAGNNGTLFVRPTADSQEADEIRYTPAGTGAVATTVQSKLRETVSVKDFGAVGDGVTDDTSAIQAAVSASSRVYFPAGSYKVTSTITKSSAGSVRFVGDGIGLTLILKFNDGDLFSISNTGSTSGTIEIRDMTLAPRAVMSSGAAINIQNDSSLPSLRLQNLFIGSSSTYEFKYGAKLKNCTEALIDGVICYGLSSLNFIAFDLSETIAATVPKFYGCGVYNALYGVNIVVSTAPGIEGIQFYGCDFVGVNTGVRQVNTYGVGYFAPQLTWIGGHINAGNKNFDLGILSQVFISNALLYNSGSAAFIALGTVSNLSITDNQFINIGGTSDAIYHRASTGPSNGGVITNNTFQISNGSYGVNADFVNFQNLRISNNVIVSGTLINKYTSGGSSIVIKDNSARQLNEQFAQANVVSSLAASTTYTVTVNFSGPSCVAFIINFGFYAGSGAGGAQLCLAIGGSLSGTGVYNVTDVARFAAGFSLGAATKASSTSVTFTFTTPAATSEMVWSLMGINDNQSFTPTVSIA